MPSIFWPATLAFVKNRAKLLQRSFPGLPLAVAQEATACALGFKDWFEATKRIGAAGSAPSAPDAELERGEQLLRRYRQIRALVDVAALPLSDVDVFVRQWGLTSGQPARLSDFWSCYEDHLDRAQTGQPTEAEIEDGWPVQLADGLMLGELGGKYRHFTLSVQRWRQLPPYLRGTAGGFHEQECGRALALVFPEDFSAEQQADGLDFLRQNEPWLYEWHTGAPPDDFQGMSLARLKALAAEAPEAWHALAVRWAAADRDTVPVQNYVVPALTGADFVRFIESRGNLHGLDLRWFGLKKLSAAYRISDARYGGHYRPTGAKESPLKLAPEDIFPVPPQYGSPFKHGPLWEMEFDHSIEGGAMTLAEELELEDEEAA